MQQPINQNLLLLLAVLIKRATRLTHESVTITDAELVALQPYEVRVERNPVTYALTLTLVEKPVIIDGDARVADPVWDDRPSPEEDSWPPNLPLRRPN